MSTNSIVTYMVCLRRNIITAVANHFNAYTIHIYYMSYVILMTYKSLNYELICQKSSFITATHFDCFELLVIMLVVTLLDFTGFLALVVLTDLQGGFGGVTVLFAVSCGPLTILERFTRFAGFFLFSDSTVTWF